MTENDPEIAGPTQPHTPPVTDTAREVFPVRFEKDYKDFSGTPVEDQSVVPKASSAPASVTIPRSVTGLEDVSEEDLENPVQKNVAKVN